LTGKCSGLAIGHPLIQIKPRRSGGPHGCV